MYGERERERENNKLLCYYYFVHQELCFVHVFFISNLLLGESVCNHHDPFSQLRFFMWVEPGSSSSSMEMEVTTLRISSLLFILSLMLCCSYDFYVLAGVFSCLITVLFFGSYCNSHWKTWVCVCVCVCVCRLFFLFNITYLLSVCFISCCCSFFVFECCWFRIDCAAFGIRE